MKTETPKGPSPRARPLKRNAIARPQFEALESRLLMAADLPIVALPPPSVELSQAPAGVHMLAPREIVVLDASLADLATLRDAIAQDSPQAEVLVLDTSRDAFDQIGEKLAAGEPVSALHLVAHGQAGQFVIRGAVIDASELARRTAQLQAWNFADNADVLLYGCNVAEGPNGRAFVDMLASLTGTNVAASSDLTGHAELGADWDLEVASGAIDTATIAGPRLRGLWRGTLEPTAELASAGSTGITSVAPPLAFERNVGQVDAAVDFLARSSDYSVYLSGGDAVIDMHRGDGDGHVVRLSLVGAATPNAVTGETPLSARSHYLVGDASDWRTDIANFGAVRYDDVYAGVDVRYYGTGRLLQYDFLVAAGASTEDIGLRLEGAKAVTIAANGDLVLTLDDAGRSMTFHAPVSYQSAADGSRVAVDSRYELRADGTVGFVLGAYDRTRALVIDPVLGYASYLGGTGLEVIEGAATDASGNLYVTGRTGSAAFPTSVGAYDTSLGGSTDAFVSKFDASGVLQYSTFLGGSGNEWAYNLAVDGSGQVHVAGETASSDFAIVNGADSSYGGTSDGYLVKLNAAGSAILYSTYYGGANADYLAGVHVGSGSTVFVAGSTTAATWDGYAAAIDTSASGAGSLTWSQTYAAAGTEKLYDMDVDSTGDIWLIGETSTSGLTTGGPYDSTHNGGADVFLVRMSAAGAVEYVTYYGGTGNDYGNAIVVAADNTLYLTGVTYSTTGIASTGAYDTTGDATNGKAFLVRLDPSQTGSAQRLFGTYFGTTGGTVGYEVEMDAEGRPVVVGQTSGTIPTTSTAQDATLSGSTDGFLATFSDTGSLRYATHLGGAGTDHANAAAVDSAGRIYVVGTTASTDMHTSGAYDTTGDGANGDGFIAQLLPLGSQATATVGGGLSLNTDGGNDAYLKADDGGAILGGRTALTLEFDFSIDTGAGSDNRLLSYAISGVDNEVSVHITAGGQIVFTLENATTTSASTYAQLLDGDRHQLAVTWSQATGNGAFYVDGTLVHSFTGFKTLASIDGGGTLVIGQDQDSVDGGYSTLQMLSGTLYDVRVFSDIRTATEIKAGRLADLPRYESGLVANWRFDDWHTDRTTTDAVSGNDLTLGHAVGTGFVASHPSLTFQLQENTATGTVVGKVTALSDDRQARIDALLAADATLTYSAQTDKFYKRDTTFRTWTSALSLATSTTLNTVAGQLVTVRSATENALLSSITGSSAVWLGAADASVEGTWRWYDGNTPADTFWQGTASGYRIDGAYTNWNTGEPSDTGGEDRLYQQADGSWNDAPDSMTSWTLIEWDADEVLDASTPITYSITSQTVSGAFAIDSDTGALTVANGGSLNYVAGVPHTLTVRVTEGSLTYDRDYIIVLADEAVEVSASVPGAQSATEDTSLTFSSGGGNAITVSDASAANTPLQVSLSVSNGTLTLSQTTGLNIVSGTNGSAAMVIDGTESALNAALSGMTYTPTTEYFGADTLQVTASLSSDLAGHYTFDTGAVIDSAAGNAQNGSFVGNATTTTDATRGTVLSLDGSGDSVQIASVFGSPTNVTVGGWVNLYNAPTRGEMISLNDRVHIALDEPGIGVKGSIQTGAASWNDLESGRFIAGDGWHHVMFVVDDTNDVNTLYIDGIEVATETNTSSVYWSGATTTYFGQHPGNTAYLHGLLDDMRVYTRALSAGEVAALAAEQRLTDPDTIALTVSAANDAPADLYFVPGLAESSLTGVYTFSVSSDLGRDAAGEDAAITLYGSPSQTTGPGGGGALDLAGGVSGQYGDIAGITTGGAMTIAGDVRFDSTAIWQRVVDFGQANSTGITAIYVGRYGTTNDLTFTLEKDLGGGNWLVHRAIATGAITNGTWLHFAATVDGSGAMVLYVDGVLADSEAGAVPEVGVRTNNYVGRSNWAGDALFDGAIDNLVVASGAMSAAGVAALYQQSNAVAIAENSANGTVLGTIVVADVDSANTHTFSLTSNPGTRFAIAADGTLTVANGSLLDYESSTSHAITARATDAGSQTRDEAFTVTLTAVNEAPSFISLNGTPAHTEGGAAVVLDADAQINDPELSAADDFSGATLTLARNGGANADDALAFDGTNVTVSGANVLVGGTQVGTYVFTGGELVVTFGANATQARVNTLLRNIVYWNWSDAPSASVQIDWTFSDENTGAQGSGGALTAPGSTTVSITGVNDPPTLTFGEGNRSFTEGGAAVMIDALATVADSDSANFSGGTLTITTTVNSTSDDRTELLNTGMGAGQVGVSGFNVHYSGTQVGTIAGGVGTSPFVVTFNSSADATAVREVMRNIRFWVAGDAPSTAMRTVEVVLTDGDGGTSSTQTKQISVTGANDAPAIADSGVPGPVSFTEQSPVAISSLFDVTDPDSANLTGATITISGNYSAGSDTLNYTDMFGISGGWNASTGTLTLSGTASVANYITAIRSIAFYNSADNPSALQRTVVLTVTDGTDTSNVLTRLVDVTAVNDAPVLNSVGSPALASVTEDSGAPTGAVGTLVAALVDFASPAGQVDNVTDGDGAAVLGIAVTEADATNGTWFYSIDSGTTWNALGAVSGSIARLLAADAGTRLYFQGNANFAGTIANAITFHAWDRTSGANGSVADLSDDTVLDQFGSVSYANNDGTNNWTSDWIETDVDGGGAGGGRLLVRPTGDLEIRARATNNNLYREVDLSGATTATLSFDFVNTLSAGDTIVVQASGNGGASYTTLTGGTFSSSLNTGSGTFSLDISAVIASNTRIRFLVTSTGGEDRLYVDNVQIAFPSALTGGSTAFSVAADTASLTVSAVNDSPTANAGGPYTIAEGATLVLNASGSSDPDGDTLTYAWDLDNDGNFGETGEPVTAGPSVTWATLQSFGIDDDGSYTIGLRVGDGTINVTTTTTVTVTNAAPTITVSGAASVAAGQTYTLTVGVTDAGADTVTSWTVNWGDGTVSTHAGSPTGATHTFVQGGFSRGIMVSVTDEDGSYSPNDLLLSSHLGDQVLRLDGTSGSLEATLPSSVTVDGPTGLAIGPDGYLYVASLATDQVVRYDLGTNTLVGTFVTAASGGLDTPAALAFGPDGHLYVASYGTNQILKYDGSTGTFLGAFASLNSANALAWGPDGHLYAGSWFTGEVRRFDISGAAVDAGAFLTLGGGFGVSSLLFGTDGYLYVGDAGSTDLLKYDATTGALAATIDGNNAPYGLAIGPDGRLLVADFNAQAVERFRFDTGASLGNFDDGATGVNRPWGLVFHPSVIVAITAGTPGVTVSAMSGSTSEAGTTATFSVVLDSAPLAPVTIALSSGDATEGSLSVSSVTFTVANWNTAQTVTVTGVDDALGDGDVTYSIVTGAASSADAGYNGLAVADVSVTNTDNDAAGVSVSTISGTITEAGGTATFTVVLGAAPSADVTIAVTSGDATEGSVSTSLLTFTPANWNSAQTVTVTGVNDNLDDGDITFTIVTGATASTDPAFQGLAVGDVTVTNVDDDATPVLTIPAPVTTSEDTSVPLTGLAVSDASGDLSALQLAVSNGSLTVSLSGGAVVSAGMNGGGSLTLSGTQGTLTAALATLRYRPSLGYSGADSLSITATDSVGLSTSGTLALSIVAVNDAPVTRDDSATTVGQSAVSGNVLTNDADAEGDSLSVTQFSIEGDPANHAAGTTATIPLTGTVSLSANGSFTFTPQVGFSGTAPRVTYTVADGNGGTATGELTLRAGTSATGWAVSGSASVTEGQSASYVVSLSDTVAFGETASVALTLTDATTSGSDHASFAAAVSAAIASRPDLAFDGTRLSYSPTTFGGYGRTYNATGSQAATSISGTGTALGLRDDEFLRVDLDFAFDYFGVAQSSVIIDANGYVTFGSSPGSVFTNGTLTTGTALGGLPAIAAFWDDLDPNLGGAVYVETLGSPGARQFVIEWSATPYFGSGSADGATIQIVLHEGSGVIEMRYLDVDFAGTDTSRDGGLGATIGLQSGSGTVDEFSFDTASVVAGSSLVYRPQGVAMSPLTIALATTDDSTAEGTEDFAIGLAGAFGSGITAADTATTLLTDNDFVAPVNVAPLAATAVEDTVLAFSGANAISVTDGDVNVTSISITVTSGTVTLTVAGGASVSSGSLGSSGFTLSGSLTQINASLATLTYTPAADFAGSDNLVVSSTDASALSDTDTVTLTVSPVDDAPVLTGVTLSVSQGGAVTLAPSDFTIVDPDGPGGTRLVDVRNLAGGVFELVSAPGTPLSTFAYADVVAGLVRFVHGGSSSPPAFEASVRDSVTPGTFVAASVGFTPTPVLVVPGPTQEQVYSIVLTNPGTTAPPAPASPPVSTSPSQGTSTGTATQQQTREDTSGSQGARGPGEVDPRLLMTMATPRTPQVPAAPAADPGAAAVTVAAAVQGAPASQAGAPSLAPLPTGTLPAPAQVDPVQAVHQSTDHAGWDMPAPLSVDLPPARADEARKQSEEEQQFDIMVNGVRLTGVSLSVGVVTWALRAGGILSSLLASLPAWRYVDPLPILERAERSRVVWRDDEDETDTPEASDAEAAERAVNEMLESRS